MSVQGIEPPERQESYWVTACPTCERQLPNSLSTCCRGEYGKTIYLAPTEQLARAVAALRQIYYYTYGASGVTGDDAGHLTHVGMMAKESLCVLGEQP